jgi:hypothetical protein
MSLHSFTSPNTAQVPWRLSLALVVRERLQDQPFACTAGRPRRPPRPPPSSPSVALPAAQLGPFGTASHVSLRLPCRNSTAPERLPSHSLTGSVAATRATSSPPRQPSLCAARHSSQLTQHSTAPHRTAQSQPVHNHSLPEHLLPTSAPRLHARPTACRQLCLV